MKRYTALLLVLLLCLVCWNGCAAQPENHSDTDSSKIYDTDSTGNSAEQTEDDTEEILPDEQKLSPSEEESSP